MEIAIPLYDRFTALDAVGPYEVLWRLPGATVHWVGGEARPYTTDGGLKLVAEATFDDVPAPDVLVVPGGTGTREALGDERLVEWIRRAHATSTWTTSVCTGALLLGAAGVLDGLRATTQRTPTRSRATAPRRPPSASCARARSSPPRVSPRESTWRSRSRPRSRAR